MSLQNNNFISFDGEALGGRAPTALGKRGENRTSPELAQAVDAAYNKFCSAVNTSNHPLGVHTKHHAFEDGSRVTFSSNNGVHKVLVTPAPTPHKVSVPEEDDEIKELFKLNTFFCIPFDKTYPQTLAADVFYKKRWPSVSNAATVLKGVKRMGGDESNESHMAPAPVSVGSQPGNTTWFPTASSNHKLKHIVLSWWGPNQRYENTQGFKAHTQEWASHLQYEVFPWTYGASPLSPPMAHIHKTAIGDMSHVEPPLPGSEDFDRHIWVNGRHVFLDLGKSVLSACAAELANKKHVVRILMSTGGGLPTHIVQLPLRYMIDLSLKGGAVTEVSLEKYGSHYSVQDMAAGLGVTEVFGLSQPPFWNSSGTEAAGIAYVRVTNYSGSITQTLGGTLARGSGFVGLVVYKLSFSGEFTVVERSVYNMSATGSQSRTDDDDDFYINGVPHLEEDGPQFPWVVHLEILSDGTLDREGSVDSSFEIARSGSLYSRKPLAVDFYGDALQLLCDQTQETSSYSMTGGSVREYAWGSTYQRGRMSCVCAARHNVTITGSLRLNDQTIVSRERTMSFSQDGTREFSTDASWGWGEGAFSRVGYERATQDVSTAKASMSMVGYASSFVLAAGDLRGGKIIVDEAGYRSTQFDRSLPHPLGHSDKTLFYSYLASADTPYYSRVARLNTAGSGNIDCRDMLKHGSDMSTHVGGGSLSLTIGYSMVTEGDTGSFVSTISPIHDVSGGYSYDHPVVGTYLLDTKTLAYDKIHEFSASSNGAVYKSAAFAPPSQYSDLMAPHVTREPLVIRHGPITDEGPSSTSRWEFVLAACDVSTVNFAGGSSVQYATMNEAFYLPGFMQPGCALGAPVDFGTMTSSSFSFESNATISFSGTLGNPQTAPFSASALSPDGKLQYIGYLMYSAEYVPGVWGIPYVRKGNKWFANGVEFTPADPYPKDADFKMLSSPVFTGPLPPKKDFPWR